MKAADISDRDFLSAVNAVQEAQAKKRGTHRPWALWGFRPMKPDFHAEYGPFVLDHFPDIPEKVLRAKGRRIIARGLMTGCMCGCRGDMELTDAGLAALSRAALGAEE